MVKIPSPGRLLLMLVATTLIFSGFGCTLTQTVDFQPTNAEITRHPLHVALVLDKDFRQAEVRDDKQLIDYRLAAYLVPCARYIVERSFVQATEFDSIDAAAKSPDSDAILIPKFVKLEVRQAGFAWDPRHTLVVVEWTMKNARSGKTLWLSTLEGRGNGTCGDAFSYGAHNLESLKDALTNLYVKSVDAFNRSEEIAAFARSSNGQK
jgi:hypothetical protein